MVMNPDRGYVIACAKRSGSSHLCALLNSTGALGRPDEHFHPDKISLADVATDALAAATWDRIVASAATPNGVVGIKLFFSHIEPPYMAAIARRVAGFAFVLLDRGDRLGQALSLARALQTASWSARQSETTQPRYRPALIRQCLASIDAEMVGWEGYFRLHDIVPMRLTYEDLSVAPEASVTEIARRLGVDPADLAHQRSGKTIQRDSINREWRERFLAEATPQAD
jgi:LPS sulfotransferase NodH